MKPYWSDEDCALYLGDCLDVLPTLPDASVDAIVTDPPYGLAELPTATVLQAIAAWVAGDRTHVPDGRGFMGRDWDRFVPPPGVWDECRRVLKPGGHLLCFAAPRTQDLMALSIRLAGFEIRDGIAWLFGGGMPKGRNIGKALDVDELNGWNTTLRPAHEPVVVARKPFRGSVEANVLAHGTGALNVDACRIATGDDLARPHGAAAFGVLNDDSWTADEDSRSETHAAGRWPANVVFTHAPGCERVGERLVRGDSRSGQEPGTRPGGFANVGAARGGERPNGALHGSETVAVFRCVPGCPVAELDQQSGVLTSGAMRAGVVRANRSGYAGPMPAATGGETYGDSGGASRFFNVFRYQAKAGAAERPRLADGTVWPTVKPLEFMRWLVRLVTPPGGVIFDPFVGSGTTLEAAVLEGFRVGGSDRERAAVDLCVTRLSKPLQPTLFGEAA